MEKEVLIAGQAFVIKRLSFGESNDLNEESATLKFVGTESQMKVSPFKMTELMILKSLVKAPFDITLQNIRNMDRVDGEALYQEVAIINGWKEEKK